MLLPKKEMETLQHEYWIRLAIVGLFFISSTVVLGIIALIPSYLYTQSQEKQVLDYKALLEKSRVESGADQVEKVLIESQAIAQKIIEDEDVIVYSDAIQKIISHRSSQIVLTSFELSHEGATASSSQAIVQGRAATREALLDFKKGLDDDISFTKVELPLSDLAKSKNIGFAVRLIVTQKP